MSRSGDDAEREGDAPGAPAPRPGPVHTWSETAPDEPPEPRVPASTTDTDGSASDGAGGAVVGMESPGRYAQPEEGEVLLGRGGLGEVFLVRDRWLERDVALKRLRSTAQGTARRRFLREARITARLEHPGLVPIHEVGRREDGSLYYTMRAVRGRTLASVLDDAESLPRRLALLGHFHDACQAVAYAHAHGVVHRDLKPENIMVGPFGETVVVDWGLARAEGRRDTARRDLARRLDAAARADSPEPASAGAERAVDRERLDAAARADPPEPASAAAERAVDRMRLDDLVEPVGDRTLDGRVLGTPAYMSPEQAEGRMDEIDARSDTWSLGVVLYEILAGVSPLRGEDAQDTLRRVKTLDIPPLLEVCPEAPADLAAIVDKALRRDREGRYPHAGALADDIEAFRAGAWVGAHTYSAGEIARRWVRQHRPQLTVGALAAALLLGFAAVSYLAVRSERDAARAGAARGNAGEEAARAHLGTALVGRALDASWAHDAISAEVFAAGALALGEDPVARGVIAGVDTAWRPRVLAAVHRPECTRLTDLGGNLACVTASAIEVDLIEDPRTIPLPVAATRDLMVSGTRDLVAWSDGESIGTVDLRTGARGPTFDGTDVRRLRLDPSGRFAVIGGRDPSGRSEVVVYRVADGTRLASQPVGWPPYGMAISPDGTRVAWMDDTPVLADLPGMENVRRLPWRSPFSLRFSPDGTRLLVGGPVGEVALIDVASGAVSWELAEDGGPMSGAFDGAGELVWELHENGVLRMRDASDGAVRVRLPWSLLSATPIGDGARLATLDVDHVVRLWDLGTDRRRPLYARIGPEPPTVTTIGGTRGLGTLNGVTGFFDVSTGALLEPIEPFQGRWMRWGSGWLEQVPGALRERDAHGRPGARHPVPDGIDPEWVQVQDSLALFGYPDGSWLTWDLEEERVLGRASPGAYIHRGNDGVLFPAAGRGVIVREEDGVYRMEADLSGKRRLVELSESPYWSDRCPGGTRMVLGFVSGRAMLVDLIDGGVVAERTFGQIQRRSGCTADGTRVLTAGGDLALHLWDDRGRDVATLFGPRNRLQSVSLEDEVAIAWSWGERYFGWDLRRLEVPGSELLRDAEERYQVTLDGARLVSMPR